MNWFEEWFDSPLYEKLYAYRNKNEANKLADLIEREIPVSHFPCVTKEQATGVLEIASKIVNSAELEKFDILFTFDKNLQYQQNFETYPVSVLVLNAEDNTHSTLQALVPFIKERLLGTLKKGATVITAQR